MTTLQLCDKIRLPCTLFSVEQSYSIFSFLIFSISADVIITIQKQKKEKRREEKRRKEKSGLDYAVLPLVRVVPNTVRGSMTPFNFAILSFLCESISCLNSSKSPRDISKSNISTSISSVNIVKIGIN